jgi:hypothetical protein
MNIFIDLEFSELTDNAEAISFGAVAEDGAEFYVEFDPPPAVCSDFVARHVLPLLQGGGFLCPRDEFASRLEAWLRQFEAPIQLVADSSWDWFVLRLALGGAGERMPGVLPIGRTGVTLVSVTPPVGALGDTYETARLQCFLRDPRQHHALVDARALRTAELSVADTEASRLVGNAVDRLQTAPRFIDQPVWDDLAAYDGPVISGDPNDPTPKG